MLVLPSRSEGLGRVVIEAFCRGRAVVGSRVGGIPDLVDGRRHRLLVPPGDASALADALVRVLTEPGLAARLGSGARAAAEPWLATPEEYAAPDAGARRRGLAAPVRLVFVTQEVDPSSPVLGATVAKIARARGPGRRGRRARRPRRRRRAARQLPRAPLRASARGRAAACASRRRSRASSPGPRGRPPSSRTCARSTPCSRRRSPGRSACACCSGSRTGARAGCCGWPSALATDVITVDRRSFPLDSRKVVAIGHGIDLSAFACVGATARQARSALLSLGRTSPAKGLETVIRAVARVAGVTAFAAGPSLTDEERAHRGPARAPRRRARRRGQGRDRAIRCRARRSTRLLAGADALVNNMRAGATDKVVYEAAATCLPVLASNPALGDRSCPTSCASRARTSTRSPSGSARSPSLDRARCRPRAARRASSASHSVEGWAGRVVEVASR